MRVTELYDYMRERECIRLCRVAEKPWPWTDDPILLKYKFTNVKRLHDRTTQAFASWYALHKEHPPRVQLLNCATARYFGRSEFVLAVGWQDTFQPELLKSSARHFQALGKRVFTGAYVITNQGIKAPKEEVVVDRFLTELWRYAKSICDFALSANSWETMLKYMRVVQGFGGTGFMAKEVALDTMLTSMWLKPPDDLNTWCPAGPGARRGLNRLHERPLNQPMLELQAMAEMRDLYRLRHSHWPLDWEPLELHDIQFCLCEWDKYERVRLGEGRPRSRYRAPLEIR